MLENNSPFMDTPDELDQADQGVDQEKEKDHQAYILSWYKDEPVATGEWSNCQFILQEVSGQQPPQQFDSFEQVMNFLLDELLEYRDEN